MSESASMQFEIEGNHLITQPDIIIVDHIVTGACSDHTSKIGIDFYPKVGFADFLA